MRARRDWTDSDESRWNLQREMLFEQITFLSNVVEVLERNPSGRTKTIDLLSTIITTKRHEFINLGIRRYINPNKKENKNGEHQLE